MSETPQGNDAPEQPLSRRERRAAAGDTGFRLNAVPFVIAGVVVVILTVGALWWFLGREDAEEASEWTWTEEPADGVHARDVPPEDWEAGWCLTGFSDEDSPANVISCERNYDVQVLLRREMDDDVTDGEYPGEDIVAGNANQWCHEEIELSPEAVEAVDAELQIELWHPSESTWNNDDDRLVSCFLSRADGERLSGDFLAVDDSDTDAEDADVDVVDEDREEDSANGEDSDAESDEDSDDD
ncbi:hypothetical protein [Nesterenkonia natronophila]|uniref:Septum formation-related domain-containing protein n=1 Tax=Nesterenkonia natronophila TaxID=2174932 RepID=A0A3A4F491_9MICC|nr:hypothetical protein [Nesterenkonia natronophila]RJN32551.1 hypothetical protein D3250_01530 [Nesterenkonia natronophila]